MKKFEIYLKKERTRPYRLLANLILAVNLLFFAMYLVYNWQGANTLRPFGIALGITLVVGLTGRFVWHRLPQTALGLILLFSVSLHLLLGFWWASLTLLFLAGLFLIAMRDLILRVTDTSVDYPSFPRRQIKWTELNNVIIKDGLLTVDFRNNRIAQLEAIPGSWTEESFNEFCKTYLSKNQPSGR